MATFSHKLYHPTNQNPEDIYKGFSWGAFFFGAFWFAYKGLWIPAILLFVSYFLMGVGFFLHFIIAFFAWGIHEKHFLSKGYLRSQQLSGNNFGTSTMHEQQVIEQVKADQSAERSTSQIQPQENVNTSSNIQIPDALFVKHDRQSGRFSGNYEFLDLTKMQPIFYCSDNKNTDKTALKQIVGANASASYDVIFATHGGELISRIVSSGGSFKNSSELFINGLSVGKIEKKGIFNPEFSMNSNATVFLAKTVGLGKLVSRFDLCKNSAVVATVGVNKGSGFDFEIKFTHSCTLDEKIKLIGCFYALRQFMCESV